MTDRELLELAAKAAGYDFYFNYDEDLYIRNYLGLAEYFWNPLTNDGDALRLAVKIRIDVLQKWEGAVFSTNHRYGARELYGTDPYAATRRAIVRAAAEIGAGRS